MCNKSRALFFAALVAVPLSSQALTVNLFINDAFKTVAKPNSGSVTLIFDGIIQITGSPSSGVGNLQSPLLNGSNSEFLNTSYSMAFLNNFGSLTSTPDQTYTGDLFEITVFNTNSIGSYNSSASGNSAPYFLIAVFDGVNTAEARGTFAVEVVPEPATLTLLGIPALAALRRRKNA